MLMGHVGLGLVAKRISGNLSLGVLIPLSLLPDLLALPAILFPGKVIDLIPWTHGLFMSFNFALLSLFICVLTGLNFRNAVIIGALVFSHWILDVISWPMFGRALPLFLTGSPEIGFGLYATKAGSMTGEILGLTLTALMIIILVKYRSSQKEKKRH